MIENNSENARGLDGRQADGKPVTTIMKRTRERFVDGKKVLLRQRDAIMPTDLSQRPQWFFVNTRTWVDALAKLDTWTPAGRRFRSRETCGEDWLPATEEGAARNRAAIEWYNVSFPQSEVAEHKICGRKSRNASVKYDDDKLKILREYLELHRTIEPICSLWSAGVARSDKYESGPSPEKLEAIWSDPAVQYEMRMVSTVGFAPPLSQCGYATPHFSREMKIPVNGKTNEARNVKKTWPNQISYWGVSESDGARCENAVRARLGRRVIKQEAVDAKVAKLCKPKIVSFEERSKKWTLCYLNGIVFAPYRGERNGKTIYRGEMLSIDGNDVDDRIRKPKDLECPGSKDRYWSATDGTKFGKDSLDDLKFYANDRHLNPQHYDEKEYGDIPDYDSEPEGGVTPFDVLAQKQMLAAFNRMLSPEEQATAGMLMGLNDNAAQNKAEIGRALADDRKLSDKTFERLGGKALDDLVGKLHSISQTLAA
jgi:hypothetical protein